MFGLLQGKEIKISGYEFQAASVGSLWHIDQHIACGPTTLSGYSLLIYEGLTSYRSRASHPKAFILKLNNGGYMDYGLGRELRYKVLTLDHKGNIRIGWLSSKATSHLIRVKE